MINNVLVVGLGSMGKRRIRCLQKLGVQNIIGIDTRADRCLETKDLYSIEIKQSLDEALNAHRFDAAVISVPPDLHHQYMKKIYLCSKSIYF